MFRLQNLFMDQCMNELLPDEVIDQVAEACMNAPDMQEFFRKENPYAMEEAARRFLELHQRGKWNGDPEVLTRLQEAYLEAEGDVECGLASRGEIQGGSVEDVYKRQEQGFLRLGLAGRLAAIMEADLFRMEELRSGELIQAVRWAASER